MTTTQPRTGAVTGLPVTPAPRGSRRPRRGSVLGAIGKYASLIVACLFALVPIVTVIGLTVALMIGGAVVTDTVFGLPGVGNLVVSAVLRRDYPVIQGALLVVAMIYVIINFLTDLLYLWVDPRVKF